MTARDSRTTTEYLGNVLQRTLVTIGVLVFAAATVSVILAPLVLAKLFATPSGDYSRVSDIGQAYGAASAVIATLTLGVVLAGLSIQYRQLRSERIRSMLDRTEDLVKLAMEEPAYRQCWGPRVAPDGTDEALYYYCNRILNAWKLDWDLRTMSEVKARRYLANFFDSEIPRQFWKEYGDWHEAGKVRSRRERFIKIANEEYLRAVKNGPPSRLREDREPAKTNVKPRRQHPENLSERRVVP